MCGAGLLALLAFVCSDRVIYVTALRVMRCDDAAVAAASDQR